MLDIIHPTSANVSKKDLATKLAQMYKVHDHQCIQLFGFKTQFGGGRSTGFGLIYESLDKMKKFEPKYRQAAMFVVRLRLAAGRLDKTTLSKRQGR